MPLELLGVALRSPERQARSGRGRRPPSAPLSRRCTAEWMPGRVPSGRVRQTRGRRLSSPCLSSCWTTPLPPSRCCRTCASSGQSHSAAPTQCSRSRRACAALTRRRQLCGARACNLPRCLCVAKQSSIVGGSCHVKPPCSTPQMLGWTVLPTRRPPVASHLLRPCPSSPPVVWPTGGAK